MQQQISEGFFLLLCLLLLLNSSSFSCSSSSSSISFCTDYLSFSYSSPSSSTFSLFFLLLLLPVRIKKAHRWYKLESFEQVVLFLEVASLTLKKQQTICCVIRELFKWGWQRTQVCSCRLCFNPWTVASACGPSGWTFQVASVRSSFLQSQGTVIESCHCGVWPPVQLEAVRPLSLSSSSSSWL